MTVKQFHDLALSFQGIETNPHFDRTAYKVTGRTIFATVHEESQSANLKLALVEQSAFCRLDKKTVYPVPNKFGLQGWTTFELKHVSQELMAEALRSAYTQAKQKKSK